ncbi:zinc finger protein 385B isoform X2 [Elgaria multicarinata webbii]|uniref:zinc finger protein 385B isoform X2 n=1 Tax=Elgaria multicarinata webbii TaxID=159646 RepID=UPI002FCD57F8
MKHPISPDHIFGYGIMNPPAFLRGFEEKGLRHDRPEYQLSKEKKKILFSFCEVCNIQLNSAAQAQVHYNGKSHLKRVKQLNNGKLPTNTTTGTLFAGTNTGSTCHTTTLPTLVRTPTLMMQPSLDIKPFVSFPVDGSSAVGLFPNFNTMDPVQKAVINHTFGVSLPPKKKQVISCNVCQLRFNSDSQAEAHYKGSKHAKKVKALEATKSRPKAGASKDSAKANANGSATPVPASISDKSERANLKADDSSHLPDAEVVPFISESGTIAAVGATTAATLSAPTSSKSTNGITNAISESEEEKAKKLLYCSLCKVAVNSLSQLEAHNTGSKHKTMVEARNGAGPIKSYPRPGSRLKTHGTTTGSGLQNKTFHCEICDVHVNSEIQLKQHISSRRHKDRVAGKPTKPKYSPYNKLQRSPSILAAKLAFQKEMIKPLAPAFLSSPLAAAAAAVSTTLTLPPRPSAALFQAPAIPTALLRAGHGPIRATPTSILFAPY